MKRAVFCKCDLGDCIKGIEKRDCVHIPTSKGTITSGVFLTDAEYEAMKCCRNCENEGKDHSKEPLKHCSRITVWKSAEEHLLKDLWKPKEEK